MRETLLPFGLMIVLLILPLTSPVNGQPTKGDLLPAFTLPVPAVAEEKAYLGLSGDRLFKIPQIKSKIVIVNLFSLYCPNCQKDAPALNGLFKTIEDSPTLKDKIKLIGIGTGNTPYEVEVFKKTYSVPFPLFSDKDFVIHKLLGEVRTPYFIAIKINDDQTHQVIYSELGGFNSAASFLELILDASGLKQGGSGSSG